MNVPQKDRSFRRLMACLTGVTLSAFAVVFTDRISAIAQAWSGVGLLFVVLALCQFGGIAWFIHSRLDGPTWVPGVSLFVGVPIGVLLDVTFDSIYYSHDRNLFPFEILFFWIIALGPALLASLSADNLDRLMGLESRKKRKL
jgi:hypothetical protein